MKVSIQDLISIRVTLDSIQKPEYMLQSAITNLDGVIEKWAKNIELEPDSLSVASVPNNTNDDLPF